MAILGPIGIFRLGLGWATSPKEVPPAKIHATLPLAWLVAFSAEVECK